MCLQLLLFLSRWERLCHWDQPPSHNCRAYRIRTHARTSLVLDTLPAEDGVRARSKAEAVKAAASADASADERYARAVGALLASENASEGRCVVM